VNKRAANSATASGRPHQDLALLPYVAGTVADGDRNGQITGNPAAGSNFGLQQLAPALLP